MPAIERDAPNDGALRHHRAASVDPSRALIPMWDSSDPERAPPPLPLNPQSPTVERYRANTSPAIQLAHAALAEKARENALVPTLTRRIETSPERGLVPRDLATRGSPHKRMQSLQTPSVRDLSLMLEGSPGRDSLSVTPRSPEKLSSRPHTPIRGQENERKKPLDEENRRPSTPTLMPSSLTPLVRPSVRRGPQSILGENTPPPSATMLALQNMAPAPSRDASASESPLANVTNNSTALVKLPPSMDNISNQILTLTNIASSLQKEMSLLARRSRDNATDLASLKEATHARDEDIRKSLRELATSVDTAKGPKDLFASGLFLDNKSNNGSETSKSMRPFSLPRIPSPKSFAASLDRDSMSTPSLVSSAGSDSPAVMALLEKIIREMGTKDGQDTIVERLSEMVQNLHGMATAGKIEELIKQLKSTSQELSLVPASGGRGGGGGGGGNGGPRQIRFDDDDDEHRLREIDWNARVNQGPVTQRVKALISENENRRASAPPASTNNVLNEDILKIIRAVKDSVAQGGGLTAEVKALVRELRGEVLGMGREIGRRLEEVNASATTKADSATKVQLERIVEDGLAQMKDHMNQLLREHRRASAASTKSAIDYEQIHKAIIAALKENEDNSGDEPDLSGEDVIQAVKEAWENYKPEIVVEQVGLERDEVLACLKEGLQEYAPQQDNPQGATREQVFDAIMEGLKHYNPPQVDTPASLSRDEVLEAVRECLEEFEFPVAPSALNNELTRDDMVDAVKEGLESFDFSAANAVRSQSGGVDDSEIVERLHDIMQFMKDEFKAVSDEAKQNVAANGRDTEQVLDATKDGFEQLREHLETYMNRADNSTNHEEYMTTVVQSLDGFREELTELINKSSDVSKTMLKEEIESLRDAVNSSLVPHAPPQADNREFIEALREGLERVRQELLRPHAGTTEILDALSEGFGDLRMSIEKMTNKPVDLTANDEILEALKDGIGGVRSDIGSLREQNNDKAIALADAVPSNAVIPADLVKQDDIKNLEVMLTQLRIKVEAMDPPPTATGNLSKEDLAEMEEMLRNLQDSVSGMDQKTRDPDDETPINLEDAASKEDVQAIETILRNTKARLDDLMDGEQAVRKDHIDNIEALILEAKDSLGSVTSQLESVSKKDDIVSVESLVTQITVALDEMKERAEKSLDDPERVTKTDVDAIEGVCIDLKATVEQMLKSDIAALPSKEDLKEHLKGLEESVKEAKGVIDGQAEANAQALENRQAEIVGVGERVTEVKTFLDEFKNSIKEKLENETSGLEALSKSLEAISETLDTSTVSQDLKEMLETVKTEFEESKNGVAGAKLDTDEKLQAATDSLGSKIDERISELATRLEEFQLLTEEHNKTGEARDAEMEAAVGGIKTAADDLKLLTDTLGSTVTESMEKTELASKTVFERVEELCSKSEENHSDNKNEHAMTRDEVKAAVTIVEGLQGHVVEYEPQILEQVKNILDIVGQHYEQAKSNTAELQQKIEDIKSQEVALQQTIDDVKNKPEPPLLPPPEKYDDAEVRAKLDQLIDHSQTAGKAYAQLETLDKVHAQVMQTASEISNFLEAQKQRIEGDHEEHEKTLQEAKVTLEETKISLAVAQAEKEHVEGNVITLKLEEEQLRSSISALKSEQELLTRQKTRLTADVSSLETAMQIRREELHAMEARAEGLERRILQGVLDHSRALLLSKASNKTPEAMSRKRVPGARSGLTPVESASLNASRPMTPQRKAVNLAVNGGRASLVPPNAASAGRRILSLSQINHNSPVGGMKRSQSVRNPAGATGLRKSSWAGNAGRRAQDAGHDKENQPIDAVSEIDEQAEEELTPMKPRSLPEGGDDAATEIHIDSTSEEEDEDNGSDLETLRRTSLGTTVITESEGNYTTDDDGQSEWTESVADTESGVGTESGADGSSVATGNGAEVAVYGA